MQLSNGIYITCPYCGHEKKVASALSGNTFGATQWSDGYFDCPLGKDTSWIQKCPECKKLFVLTNKIKSRDINNYDEREMKDFGEVSPDELLDGIEQLEKDDNKNNQEIIDKNVIFKFNDKYRRNENNQPSEKHKGVFKKAVINRIYFLNSIISENDKYENIVWSNSKFLSNNLKELYNGNTHYRLMIAELYREIEDFDKAINLAKSCIIESYQLCLNWLKNTLIERAEQRNADVFTIQYEQNNNGIPESELSVINCIIRKYAPSENNIFSSHFSLLKIKNSYDEYRIANGKNKDRYITPLKLSEIKAELPKIIKEGLYTSGSGFPDLEYFRKYLNNIFFICKDLGLVIQPFTQAIETEFRKNLFLNLSNFIKSNQPFLFGKWSGSDVDLNDLLCHFIDPITEIGIFSRNKLPEKRPYYGEIVGYIDKVLELTKCKQHGWSIAEQLIENSIRDTMIQCEQNNCLLLAVPAIPSITLCNISKGNPLEEKAFGFSEKLDKVYNSILLKMIPDFVDKLAVINLAGAINSSSIREGDVTPCLMTSAVSKISNKVIVDFRKNNSGFFSNNISICNVKSFQKNPAIESSFLFDNLLGQKESYIDYVQKYEK